MSKGKRDAFQEIFGVVWFEGDIYEYIYDLLGFE